MPNKNNSNTYKQKINPKINHKIKLFFKYSIRLFYIGSHKFYKDACFEKASSLSFVTILSVVPVFILVFSFLNSYEYTKIIIEDNINYIIHLLFGSGLEQDITSYLKDFSDNVSQVSYIAIVFLLFISVDIILILEKSVNLIWNIKKGRSFIQNFFIYWLIITVTPFFLISSFYLISQYNVTISQYNVSSNVSFISFEYFPLIITAFAFFVIYSFLPRQKVNILSALIGAVVAGLLFELGKIGFGFYIAEIVNNTLKKIYGSTFYVIPIFIAWIYFSYAIMLYGAEIAYIVQHPEILKYKIYKHIDNNKFTLYFILNSIYHIFNNFKQGKGPTTIDTLAKENNIPKLLMEDIVYKLDNIGIITETTHKKRKAYIPEKPQDKIKIIDIIKTLETRKQYIAKSGNNTVDKLFNHIQSIMKNSINNSFKNLYLSDIMKNI